MESLKKGILLWLFILLGLGNRNLVAQGDPNLLKGTWFCFVQEYKYLSPVNGAIAWEAGYIRRLYEQGDKDSATIQLVKMLFHSPLGTFDVTQNKKICSAITPEKVGHLLASIELALLNAPNVMTFSKELKRLLSDDPEVLKLQEKIRTLKNSKIGKLKKIDLQLEKNKEFVEPARKLREENRQLQKELLAKQAENKRRGLNIHLPIDMIVRSLIECGCFANVGQNQVAQFMPFTTQTILQAVLYRKAESKEVFARYFLSLKKYIPQAFIQHVQFEEEWVHDIFLNHGLQEVQTFLEEEIKPWFNGEQGANFDEWLALHYEEIVFNELMAQYRQGVLPTISNHAKEITYGGYCKFSDCCETSVRNMVNIIFYDSKNARLIMQNLPKESKPCAALQSFYEGEYASLAAIEKTKTHQAWASMVSNIPGVAYNKAICLENNTISEKGPYIFFKDAQIKEDFSSQIIGGVKYVVVNPKKYQLCEMVLNKQTLVVWFNYFLGLGLFDNVEVALDDNNFVRTYFPQMCEKLHWQVTRVEVAADRFDDEDTKEGSLENLYNFKLDKPIELFIKTASDQEFSLYLTGEHAEVRVSSQVIDIPEYREQFFSRIFNTIPVEIGPNTFFNQSLLMLYRQGVSSFPEIIQRCMEKPIHYRYALLRFFYFLYPCYTQKFFNQGQIFYVASNESDFLKLFIKQKKERYEGDLFFKQLIEEFSKK